MWFAPDQEQYIMTENTSIEMNGGEQVICEAVLWIRNCTGLQRHRYRRMSLIVLTTRFYLRCLLQLSRVYLRHRCVFLFL